MGIRDLFEVKGWDKSEDELTLSTPSLVLEGGRWIPHAAGKVKVTMYPFQWTGVEHVEADAVLDKILCQGIDKAFGGVVPLGRVGALYEREPWRHTDAALWGRYGAIIFL